MKSEPGQLNHLGGSPSRPRVKLVDATAAPFNLSIAAARTCYSAKGILSPEDVSATEVARSIRNRVADSTLKAGHLTTRQHPQFVFAIENVSRQLVWSFLHSHPYYNSEQVSQRYVEVRPDQFYVPSSLRQSGRAADLDRYMRVIHYAMDAYLELMEALLPVVAEEYFRIFPARKKREERHLPVVRKKAMEAARYILPVATLTYLYHTVNGLTLHRYHRLSENYDIPEETRILVEEMVAEASRVDPDFTKEFYDPLPLEETTEYRFFEEFYGDSFNPADPFLNDRTGNATEFIREFDRKLAGRISRLSGFSVEAEETLCDSIRSVLGIPSRAMDDGETMELLFDPQRNPSIASILNENSLNRISRALYNVQYTFQKKISHTADSQDQRHRTVPGARPLLMSHFTGKPDYITPFIMGERSALLERFQERMDHLFGLITEFASGGGRSEETVYLLPNAFPIRFFEAGNLLDLQHKWRTRTCYNAQEEIFAASLEEVLQVEAVHPSLKGKFRPPCHIRKKAGIAPPCPEGDRYCGVRVWELPIEKYRRIL